MVATLAATGEHVSHDTMQSALSRMAFVPRAESARPILVEQIGRYLEYRMPVQPRMDALELVDRVYVPVSEEPS